jgi:DNA gyrase inhibitor GyrI
MRGEDPGGYETIVRQAVREIQRRLNDSPDFRELAAAAYLSPFHFHRLFHAMVGESPRELARRLLLERAAVAAFYDDPETVPDAELRAIAAVFVGEQTGIGELEEVWLPAGRYLVAEHVGHPSGLPQAWDRVYREHIPASGHTSREGTRFEVYRSGDHSDPDAMRTQLYAPIA